MAKKPTLAYIVATNLEHPGLTLKFEGQLDGLSTYFQTQFIYYHYKNNDSNPIKLIKYLIFELMSLFAFMGNNRIYLRYDPKAILSNIYAMLFSLYKPVYLEHNGIFDHSLSLLNRKAELKLHLLTQYLFQFFPITHIGVTKQIQSFLKSKKIKQTLYIQNGYQKVKSIEPLSKQSINLLKTFRKKHKKIGVFIGNGYVWHGMEKISDLFKQYPDIGLVVIGKGYENNNKSENILFMGPLNSSKTKLVFEFCDFGVGAFNCQLTGFTEVCPLKTREYLCYGLPILINIADCASDFTQLKPYIFNYAESEQAFEDIIQVEADKDKLSKLAEHCFSWKELLKPII